jgi:hypothetical protein
MTAVAWVVFPLVFYVVAAGIGLLAERVARTELPDALLAPVGTCLAIVVVVFVLWVGGAGAAMGGALVILAIAGLVVARDRAWSRLRPGWPAIAALAGFALYMGPVVLSGHWTWLGYNFVNDTATNFALIDHLVHHGLAMEHGEPSTRLAIVNGSLAQRYPVGVHGLVGAFDWLVPAPLEAIYQPFIATLAAFAAMALAWLAVAVGVPGVAAMVAGVVAVGANLIYQYALQGSFKEIALVLVVATATAVCRFALDKRLAAGAIALLGVCLAAGVGVFTAGAAGYAVGLGGIALVAVLVERPPQRLTVVGRGVAVGAVAMVVAVGPILADSINYARASSTLFANTNPDLSAPLTSPEVLGNLLRPLPIYQSLGTWLQQDYRVPTPPGVASTLTAVLLAVAAALLVFAVVTELRRRRLGTALAVVPAVAVYLVAAPRLDPYAEAKLLVVMSPMVVFAAAAGAWWVYRRLRPAGIVAAVALVGGVLVSDALAYRNAHIVPVQRMEALRDAAEHASGSGPWLFPEWEEYAKYFGKAAAINVSSESFSPRSIALNKIVPVFNHSFDLDLMQIGYVESWPGIMLRRSPENSRPPVNYELTFRNAYYELWERRTGAPRVLEHLPLQSEGQAATEPVCQNVRDLARRMKPGERLVAAQRGLLPTVAAVTDPPYGATRPTTVPSWGRYNDDPTKDIARSKTVATNGQGVLAGRLDVDAGTYEVWLKGGGGRALHVAVDGREVGVQQQINTPGQWLPFGRVELAAGTHELRLSRPGGGLEPGDGVNGPIGGIALERVGTRRPIVDVPRARAAEVLCGHTWDWIERVAP